MKIGVILNNPYFTFRYIKQEIPQYSFVVPKKIQKNAILRNKFRRIGYNFIKKNEQKPVAGIFFYKKEAFIDKSGIGKEITSILNKIK